MKNRIPMLRGTIVEVQDGFDDASMTKIVVEEGGLRAGYYTRDQTRIQRAKLIMGRRVEMSLFHMKVV